MLFISRFVSHRLARLWSVTLIPYGYSLHYSDFFSPWIINSLADDLVSRRSLPLVLICWVNGKSLTILALWKGILAVSRATGSWAFTVGMPHLLIPLSMLLMWLSINDLRVLEVDGLSHMANSPTHELIDIPRWVLQGCLILNTAVVSSGPKDHCFLPQLALQRRALLTWLLWRLYRLFRSSLRFSIIIWWAGRSKLGRVPIVESIGYGVVVISAICVVQNLLRKFLPDYKALQRICGCFSPLLARLLRYRCTLSCAIPSTTRCTTLCSSTWLHRRFPKGRWWRVDRPSSHFICTRYDDKIGAIIRIHSIHSTKLILNVPRSKAAMLLHQHVVAL